MPCGPPSLHGAENVFNRNTLDLSFTRVTPAHQTSNVTPPFDCVLQVSENVLERAVANTQANRRDMRNSGVERSCYPNVDKKLLRGAPMSQHRKAPMRRQRQPNMTPWVVRVSRDKAGRLHRN